MSKLVIIGAGGFGREVYEWSLDCKGMPEQKVFIDDNPSAVLDKRVRALVIGSVNDYFPQLGDVFVCAIGTPLARKHTIEIITKRGGRFISLIHPTAKVASTAIVNDGVIICPFALVSVNATLGLGSVVYYHSSIDHDAVVGSFCQISGHCDIAGGAILGSSVFMGSHAAVLPKVIIGNEVIVGAGAIVLKNIEAGVTIVGVPAKPIVKYKNFKA